MSIVEEIKHTFRNGSFLTRLIYINLALFLVIRVIYVLFVLFGIESVPVLEWLSLPASAGTFLAQPWSIISYMFLHYKFLHILFNLLWLYWFGKIFLKYLDENKLLGIYLWGGIAGALFFMVSYNLFPAFGNVVAFSSLLGASASVMAIVVAIATYAPNHVINLMFIGAVRIKHIALVSVVLYFLSIATENPGGNLAHLGGALWGYLYIKALQRGKDWNWGINALIRFAKKATTRKKQHLTVTYRRKGATDYAYNARKNVEKERVNHILDKIGKSGYESLSKEEKEILFKMGNNKEKH